jgi:hypothetical protein
MKKIALSIFCFLLAFSVSAQTGHEGHDHAPVVQQQGTATEDFLVLKETEHDFPKFRRANLLLQFEIKLLKTPLKLDN